MEEGFCGMAPRLEKAVGESSIWDIEQIWQKQAAEELLGWDAHG